MKNLVDFINEVQRINITVNRYYSVLNNWFAENEIPEKNRSDLQMQDFLSVNMSSPEMIGECYNGAKMDLMLLTDEQRKSVLKSLQSFNYKWFYNTVSEFYQSYNAGEAHPMHVADFYEFLRNNFLCTIPENGEISLKFLDDLILDISNKNSYCDALINYITENSTPPPPVKFTANKIIDIYDPKKVHTEFRKELGCTYETFKVWLVDGVICDKKMSWKYKNGNKTQLRSFIYNLCGGWTPNETNTAFKIIVDSNNRDTQINNDLLQRLEKCRKD